jgi:lipid-A-disaccharide synthase
VQYVSPQVWAWRAGRVYQVAADYDLVLSIFPFEKAWYAKRVPQLPVEFLGHPIFDRYGVPSFGVPSYKDAGSEGKKPDLVEQRLSLLLLPGSRRSELERHIPVMAGALAMMRTVHPNLRARMVLPNPTLLALAKKHDLPDNLEIQIGGLAEALKEATIAIASTGTVTVECAYFGVPTVAIYKTSWFEFQIGKRIATVDYAAMPNLLANEEIYPEFIQHMASAGNIARAALDLLRNEPRQREIRLRLEQIIASLGPPGASSRAADAILRMDSKLLQ